MSSLYIAQYPGMLAEVHLDYFGRGYRRSIELFTPSGSLVADFGAGTLTLPDGTVEAYTRTSTPAICGRWPISLIMRPGRSF